MKILGHSLVKRVTAVILLGLLLFIYTEKVVHQHDRIVSNAKDSGFTTAGSYFSCSICDYVFAMDADEPVYPELSFSYSIFRDYVQSSAPGYERPEIIKINGRGPPAC